MNDSKAHIKPDEWWAFKDELRRQDDARLAAGEVTEEQLAAHNSLVSLWPAEGITMRLDLAGRLY